MMTRRSTLKPLMMTMMNNINDGGPAFPIAAGTGDPRDGVYCQSGMSLRDWFAGMALQQFVDERDFSVWQHEKSKEARHEIAAAAYSIADAMLKAREQS